MPSNHRKNKSMNHTKSDKHKKEDSSLFTKDPNNKLSTKKLEKHESKKTSHSKSLSDSEKIPKRTCLTL